MEIKHLLSYTAVVRLGSFSRAADELFIAQPTISLHIRQLEEELHTKLLIRTTRSIEVTEKGREVYDCAVSILQLRDRILESCSEMPRRMIRLGASTIPSAYILPELLPAYVSQHPATYFTIEQGDSRAVLEKLAEGVVDIAIVGANPSSGDIACEPFCEDSVVVITPVAEPYLSMSENAAPSLTDLLRQPVILREEGSGSRKAADVFLEHAGVALGDLNVSARINDPEAIKNLVTQGLGISMISSLAADDYRRGNRLLVFSFPEIASRRHFYIATRRHAVLSDAAQDFVQYLRQRRKVSQ